MIEDDKASEKLLADVESVKIALQRLGKPQLESVVFTRGFEAGPNISADRSYFDVKIDPRLIPTILTACGYPPDQQQEISIVFRAASIADKNFCGHILGGSCFPDKATDQLVEIFTSIPWISIDGLEVADALSRTSQYHFAIADHVFVMTILEEIRHAIQKKLNLFELNRDSMKANGMTELREIDYELEAERFVEALIDHALPFVQTGRYQIDALQEMYLDDSQVSKLLDRKGRVTLPNFVQQGLVVRTIDTDPVGLYLVQEVGQINATNNQAVDNLFARIESAYVKKQLGFVEVRWLFEQLFVKLKDAKNGTKLQEIWTKTSFLWA